MLTSSFHTRTLLTALSSAFMLMACASSPTEPKQVSKARSQLSMLQANPALSKHAPVAIKDAEIAVRAAEVSQTQSAQDTHLMYIAERKVDTAIALAESRALIDQRTSLSQQRESARLDARTQEVDVARSQAEAAQLETKVAQEAADRARQKAEADRMRTLAAQQASTNAEQNAADLQRQIKELNAKQTPRGLVITLGDVLFDTDKTELKRSASSNLSKLAGFLNQHQDRSVMIEGHTDSVGREDYNLGLSQRRADAVSTWLIQQGIRPERIKSVGMGEGAPIAENTSPTGRQLNRRVEIVIENTAI